jgi:uncharacterized protein YqiB (DUF1249 family)
MYANARNDSVPLKDWKESAYTHLLNISDELFDNFIKVSLTSSEVRQYAYDVCARVCRCARTERFPCGHSKLQSSLP